MKTAYGCPECGCTRATATLRVLATHYGRFLNGEFESDCAYDEVDEVEEIEEYLEYQCENCGETFDRATKIFDTDADALVTVSIKVDVLPLKKATGDVMHKGAVQEWSERVEGWNEFGVRFEVPVRGREEAVARANAAKAYVSGIKTLIESGLGSRADDES